MPSLPSSCYRLQLRNGMTFAAATRLLPYLFRLGISHLYLSPVFAAQPGSTHGYDVIDPTMIDPALGGRAGFERLSQAAHAQGMGIILDIVPNHVAFTLENPWVRDVLARGRNSRYFGHFDILPDQKLALPMLEAPFEEVLDKAGFTVAMADDGPVLVHGQLRVPLDPVTLCHDLPRPTDRDEIRALHDRQFWRLCHWRTERDAITHRRFFNITGLIGVRVEDESVFEDSHRLIFDLIGSGAVSGLRIDHIDGLADPASYLRRLHARLPDTPVWLEKILAPGETLPDWPVAGTTGYVLACDIGQLLTDCDGAHRLDTLYQRETGRQAEFGAIVVAAKRAILETELAAELWQLQALASALAATDRLVCEYGPETWRQTILALIAHLGRYRTYLAGDTPRGEDIAALNAAADAAATGLPDRRPLDFLRRALIAPNPASDRLRLRFQQVAGAVMAKGQEDTAFYRYNRLLSANEVGAEPELPAICVATFHRRMQARARDMPHGLSLTSSHDTKRSEDARMRIAALAHHPETMAALMDRANDIKGADRVDANLRWYLVQSLWALYPGAGSSRELAGRLCDHATKAMREAKEGTTWQDPDDAYEAPVLTYVNALVAAFTKLPEVTASAARTAKRLSLAQLALKLTLPGIPDIYQGCEVGNYRLTDPDNRAAVDFDRLDAALEDTSALPPLDREKLGLTRTVLALRRDHPALFTDGSYEPLETHHDALGFRRRMNGQSLRVMATLGPPLDRTARQANPDETRIWPPDSAGASNLSSSAIALFSVV